MPEEERQASEVKFKQVSEAYEILSDGEKRHLYDTHGMAAFDKSQPGMGPEVDLNDILSQMFGFNMGDPGASAGPRRPRKGPDEEQEYKVTLEELYKGKTVKFAANKQVVCALCKGSGGKDRAKPVTCERCKGRGTTDAIRQVGPGLMGRETVICDHCSGSGKLFKEKDRCKKCKGKRTTQEKKVLEIYIPRGSMQGERIVLEGEADQHPDQVPGDIVFTLVEEHHETFARVGYDLSAELKVSLAEALTGFNRVVLKHLDGRGIALERPRGKILRPGDCLKVPGEGMPMKRGETKGDLYLMVHVEFPEDGWLKDDAAYEALVKMLPPPPAPVEAEEVDEVHYEDDAEIEQVSLTCALYQTCLGSSLTGSRWVRTLETRASPTNGRTMTCKRGRHSVPRSRSDSDSMFALCSSMNAFVLDIEQNRLGHKGLGRSAFPVRYGPAHITWPGRLFRDAPSGYTPFPPRLRRRSCAGCVPKMHMVSVAAAVGPRVWRTCLSASACSVKNGLAARDSVPSSRLMWCGVKATIATASHRAPPEI